MKHNFQKTIGKKSSKLLLTLLENGWTIFDVPKASSILGVEASKAAMFVDSMIQRGLIVRLKGGLYQIVPLELGEENTYLGDPFIVMAELAASMKLPDKYFISHGSSMELHQMITQPQFTVFATVPKFLVSRNIQGTKFHFVTSKPAHFFGYEKHWRTKTKYILISDLERTVIDGLRQPNYCGGINEVAKGIWIKRDSIDPLKLIDYALKINSGAVYRSLGYLCFLYNIVPKESLEVLKKKLTASYQALDPNLPKEGRHLKEWRILINIPEEELLAIVRT